MLRLALALLLTVSASGQTPSGEEPGLSEADQAFADLLGTLGVDFDMHRGTLEISGWVNMQRGLVEVFACAPDGKTHEAVVVLDCVPSGLHAGLLALGLAPGTPVEVGTDGSYVPPTGDRVDVLVRWVDAAGQTRTARAEEWIANQKNGKAMRRGAWIFAGSFLQPVTGSEGNATYAADFVKSLVTTYHDATSVLENPHAAGIDDTVYFAHEAAVPAVGTPITCILRPAEVVAVEGAAPARPDESGLDGAAQTAPRSGGGEGTKDTDDDTDDERDADGRQADLPALGLMRAGWLAAGSTLAAVLTPPPGAVAGPLQEVSIRSEQLPRRDYHLDPSERAAVDALLLRGSAALLARQAADGSFPSRTRPDACPVALTGMALWALSRADAPVFSDGAGLAAVEALLAHRQRDGGLYRADAGLALFTSGVAHVALSSFAARVRDEAVAETLSALDVDAARYAAELFAYRGGVPESQVDLGAASKARRVHDSGRAAALLEQAGSDSERRALSFLAGLGETSRRGPVRTRAPGWTLPDPRSDQLGYDDVLGFLHRPVTDRDPRVRRALLALQRDWTTARNPDLTRRYGPAGFQQPQQGLYHHYALAAKALWLSGRPVLDTDDGAHHDWVRELITALAARAGEDGAWTNPAPRWWEDEPVLTTSYALLALSWCRETPPLRIQPSR